MDSFEKQYREARKAEGFSAKDIDELVAKVKSDATIAVINFKNTLQSVWWSRFLGEGVGVENWSVDAPESLYNRNGSEVESIASREHFALPVIKCAVDEIVKLRKELAILKARN